jgi:hypothetical protein
MVARLVVWQRDRVLAGLGHLHDLPPRVIVQPFSSSSLRADFWLRTIRSRAPALPRSIHQTPG